MAIWQKYPNPFASHVISSDVLDRFIDEKGVLHTTRLVKKKGKMPSWGARFFNITEAFILETSTVNLETNSMEIVSKNLSYQKILLVQETMTIEKLKPMESMVTLKAQFISNTSFTPIRSRIEQWALERFRKTTENVIF
jgi:hypothetical protein